MLYALRAFGHSRLFTGDPVRSIPIFLFIMLFCGASVFSAADPPPATRHITFPFKTIRMSALSQEGVFTLDIEDVVHGKLTLTLRITQVTEVSYTVAADGTDYENTYGLPAEDRGGAVVNFKKRQLGEPLDAKKNEALARFLLAAKYYRYAEAELAGLPEGVRKELQGLVLEGKARQQVQLARDLAGLGQFEDSGRLLAAAMATLADPGEETPTLAALQRLQDETRQLQAQVSSEASAQSEWLATVKHIKDALEGARGDEGDLIIRLLPDLDGPLPGVRRRAILKALRAETLAGLNYTRAVEALKEFSFAVRYGAALKREDLPSLDDYFAAEHAVHQYLEGEATRAPHWLEKALTFRTLTDKAFEALVRLGRRVPPPPLPLEGASARGPFKLEASQVDEVEVAATYKVVLPVGYHPARKCPLLLVLHGTHADALTEMRFWMDEATRRGWLVAGLECVIGRGKGYMSTYDERNMALRALVGCAKHFAVDSSRVYVAGHSMGGHMAWDLALTYPDLFAAAVPFTGCVNGISSNYVTNVIHVPFYCISGERDAQITKVNRKVDEWLRKQGRPITYVEYRGRGHELFVDETAAVMDWMDKQSRPRAPKEIDFVSLDMETNRVSWLAMANVTVKKQTADSKPLPDFDTAERAQGMARLTGTVGANNSVEIKASNIPAARVFVTAELFDLAKPLQPKVNGRTLKPVPLTPSRKTLLELARQSGDRERLYWAVVDVVVPKP